MATTRRTRRPVIGEDIYAGAALIRATGAYAHLSHRPITARRKTPQQRPATTYSRGTSRKLDRPARGFGAVQFTLVVLFALGVGVFSVGGFQAAIDTVSGKSNIQTPVAVRQVEFTYTF